MHSLAVISVCIRRVSPIHHTHHPSHALISIPAFDTPDDWGLRGGVAAAAAAHCCSRRRCYWCWGNFNPRHNLATRVHTTHLFWSLPPSLQRSCWPHPLPSKTHPRLATPARLNTARYKSPTRDSAHLHIRFSLLSSGLCSRSSTRFLTPAPVATQRSLQNSGSKPSRVFRRFSVAPRVVSQTQPFPPIPSNSPILSSFHPSHRLPHTRGLPSSGHTTPSNLALDAYRHPRFCVSDPRHGLITLVSAFDLWWTDLLTLESFFSRA